MSIIQRSVAFPFVKDIFLTIFRRGVIYRMSEQFFNFRPAVVFYLVLETTVFLALGREFSHLPRYPSTSAFLSFERLPRERIAAPPFESSADLAESTLPRRLARRRLFMVHRVHPPVVDLVPSCYRMEQVRDAERSHHSDKAKHGRWWHQSNFAAPSTRHGFLVFVVAALPATMTSRGEPTL